jgi:thiamine pyrophosphate-dependent acetolactate synthase large subunit-like protein
MLVGAKKEGIRVVDVRSRSTPTSTAGTRLLTHSRFFSPKQVRHEVNAAFAADAVSRLTGTAGVCAVTAGPGLTNVITAVKNCQMAQTPMVVLGGATSDILKGRASLQDIDQFALFKPHVKYMAHVSTIAEIAPALEKAFYWAMEGTPGPVFVEFAVDVLYPKSMVSKAFNKMKPPKRTLVEKAINWYMDYHCNKIYAGMPRKIVLHEPAPIPQLSLGRSALNKVVRALQASKKPVMIIGSQTMLQAPLADELQKAVLALGVPSYLSGMARGLLGRTNPLQMRHNRRNALKECDLVILVGVAMDFRLEYGHGVPRRTSIVSINRDKHDLYLNRWPTIPVYADPAQFLIELAKKADTLNSARWTETWLPALQASEQKREDEISEGAKVQTDLLNPVHFCRKLEEHIGDNAILVGDGGDFVATCAYTIKPRGPLTWLDPGPFGTLGIGLGFAIGAKLVKPESEVWVLFGDGASGYSLMEFDTCTRFNIPVIAVIGNDACWRQIERDQVDVFHDDVACALAYTRYDEVAKALGAEGFLIDSPDQIDDVLKRAREVYAQGKSVVINAKISKHDFRKGSISI